MGEYYSVRIWQLKPGHTGAELEELLKTGFLELQRWIPGMKNLTLVRLGVQHPDCYLLLANFTSQEAYVYWLQVEEEAPDYWERFASVLVHWGQLSELVEEYTGEAVVEARIEDSVQS